MMSTLAYADEVVDPADDRRARRRSTTSTVTAKELTMAELLVESLTGDFEPDKYDDDYREQVLDLIAKKAAGEEFEAPEPAAEAPKVVDLMAALEASVKAAKDARERHPATVKPASVKAVKETGSGRRAAAATAVAEEDEDEEQPARKKPARTRARKSA